MATTLSRTKAVRDKCFDCSGFDRVEVRNCKHEECPLHPYRTTRSTTKKSGRPQAVRDYCLGCSGGNVVERARCESVNCPLHPFRTAQALKEAKMQNKCDFTD